MREIKFRSWDSDNKEMYPSIPDFEGKSACLWYGYELQDGGTDDPIMQYTGLKDINGKKIYEGDIVVMQETDFIFVDNGPNIWVIKFKDGGFYGEYKKSVWPAILFKAVEVIGNIYENPELLENVE